MDRNNVSPLLVFVVLAANVALNPAFAALKTITVESQGHVEEQQGTCTGEVLLN